MNLFSFSPELVVIGGAVARAGEALFAEVRDTVKKRAFTAMVNPPEIVPSSLGGNASSIGAAALVLEDALEAGDIAALTRASTGSVSERVPNCTT